MKQRFFIRQLTQPQELRQMFAQRYRVFRESEEAIGFAPENAYGLTIDVYDSKSIHFGLFHDCGTSGRLVGSMRICFADGHVRNEHVFPLCMGCHELEYAASKPAKELPFLGYSHLGPEVQEWFDKLERPSLVEPGRFFVESASRHCGLGLFMLRSITAIAHFHLGIETAIIGASRVMAPMYLKFGFVRMPGMGYVQTNGVEYALLLIRPGELPQAHKYALMQKAEEYDRTGQVLCEANDIQFTPKRLKQTA